MEAILSEGCTLPGFMAPSQKWLEHCTREMALKRCDFDILVLILSSLPFTAMEGRCLAIFKTSVSGSLLLF
jgi:hypothetical protein